MSFTSLKFQAERTTGAGGSPVSFVSLLPYNATQFEIKVEEALQYNVDATLLNGFKFKEADRLRLSLIYEYDLRFCEH